MTAERARPYIVTHDSNDSTDYINAVYVDVSTLTSSHRPGHTAASFPNRPNTHRDDAGHRSP